MPITMLELTRVVDSWAMVAWVRDESAAGAVEEFLDEAGAGLCQLTEIARPWPTSSSAGCHRFRFAWFCRIKAAHAVAFGDASAIALAQSEQASVITGDGEIRRGGGGAVG